MKANLLGATILTLGALALSSCADQRVIPAPAQTQTPGAVPRPAPVSPATSSAPAPKGWADSPATPGDWTWRMEGSQSVARFANTRLVMRCDPGTRRVRFERAEAGRSVSGPVPIKIVTQTQTRAFSAVPQGGGAAIDLAPRDPLLDAMAFSKGRFAVEAAGMPTLYVPSWTEVSRVVEDCR